MTRQRPYKLCEMMELMRISESTALRIIHDGDVKAEKVAGKWYVHRAPLNQQLGIIETPETQAA